MIAYHFLCLSFSIKKQLDRECDMHDNAYLFQSIERSRRNIQNSHQPLVTQSQRITYEETLRF